MATRMQQRRGTAAQWTAANPILAAGEIGFETDTSKFKMGNGSSNWSALQYFANAAELAAILGSGDIPALLNSIDELAAAMGDDPQFLATLNTNIGLKAPINNPTFTGTVGGVTKSMVGLGNADNTSDADKPVSTAAQTALDAKAPLASAALTGVPTAPTAMAATNTTQIATTEFVQTKISSLINGAPGLLDTLNEIAAAINDDENYATTITNNLALKADATYVDGALTTHASNTTLVHGIADTSLLATTSDVQDAADSAASALTTHASDTTLVHGIADTSLLATLSDVEGASDSANSALSTHASDTTSVHGIADTTVLVTTSDLSAHASETENVHGIADTTVLVTQQELADAIATSTVDQEDLAGVGLDWNTQNERFDIDSTVATKTYADDAVTDHNDLTQNVHGIADTAALATKSYADTAEADAITAAGTEADSKIATAVAALTKSSVGLANVDNTSDANKPVSTATQTALNDKLNLSGGTLTGNLTLSGAPTSDLHAATKQYVDGLAAGINFHQPVVAATSGNLAGTYNNGTSGVGATITAASNGSIGTIDGVAVSVGNRILLRAQTDAKQNGVYTVTAVGSAGAPYVVTRATDADNNPVGELATGDFTFVTGGSTNGSRGFILSTIGTITIGTTEVNYAQFNASEAVIAGTNISKSGATISVLDAPTFSGLVTAAASGVAFSDGTQTKEGTPSRTPIIQKSAGYTLSALTERDSLIEVSAAGVITVPTDATLNYPIGTSIDILQTGTGEVSVAPVSGTVTINATPGRTLRTQWSSATLFKRAANTWVMFGDLK